MTAYSQITGIQKETKQEIVKTLLDYPLVIAENDNLNQQIKEFKELVDQLTQKSNTKDGIIDNQSNEIENLVKQKKLYQEEVDRKRSYGFLYGQLDLNGFDTYSLGLDYVFKETVIIGSNITYNGIYNDVNLNVKIGFKIF